MLLDFTNPRLPVGVKAEDVFDSMNTPNSIALDMVNITWKEIKDRVDKDWVFLNVCCKTGVFPTNLFDKLVTCKNLVKAFPNYYERRHWILENMIKCVSTNQTSKEFSGLYLYGLDYIVYEHNIKVIPENEVCAYLRKLKGDNMRFDIVIGNPPYNRGKDLDFVNLSFELATRYVTMVTPAKWQTAESDQDVVSETSYGQFRKKLVKHIKEVVFYPCCKDVFDIFQTDGITYYILDKKNEYDKAWIENRCNDIKEFNSREYRSIGQRESLLNIGNEIIQSLGDYESFKFPEITHTKKYEVWMNSKVSGYDWYATNKPRYVLSISRVIDNSKNEKYDGEAKCIFESDSADEIKSFASWIYSRFTRFFLIPNISKLNNIQTNNCFRFVPSPILNPDGTYNWSINYTDELLYEYYGLKQEYIDVIEATVKERK